MKKIIWELQYLSLPNVLRYCKKCGGKTEFICSERFRVNAQRKYLDVWLIYKCSNCDTTWNATVYSRISPQSLPAEQLKGFLCNDKALALHYAVNRTFLLQNGAEPCLPAYTVNGNFFILGGNVRLEIKSKYPLPVRVFSIVKEKLQLSNKALTDLMDNGKMTGVPQRDLRKCKLNNSIVLIFK